MDRVRTATRGRAASLHAQLRGAGVRPGWLQAVVVIWADFQQRSVQRPHAGDPRQIPQRAPTAAPTQAQQRRDPSHRDPPAPPRVAPPPPISRRHRLPQTTGPVRKRWNRRRGKLWPSRRMEPVVVTRPVPISHRERRDELDSHGRDPRGADTAHSASGPSRSAAAFRARRAIVPWLEREEEPERAVDSLHLCGIESAGRRTQPLRIDDGRLLDEHARLRPQQLDRRSEGGRPRARGRRCNEYGAEPQEVVGLNDDRVARSALLSASHTPSSGQAKDLATDHGQCSTAGANSANCSRIARISSRSATSPASRRTSSRTAARPRRRAAASCRAVLTASESFRPSARTTSSAAALASSSRTCRERATTTP